MTAETNDPDIAIEKSDSSAHDVEEQKKLDLFADRAAKRAEQTERRYDEEHGIFTK